MEYCTRTCLFLFIHQTFGFIHHVLHVECFSQLKSPGIVTTVDGKNKTLYIATVKSIEEATKPNLKKSLKGTCTSTKVATVPVLLLAQLFI